MSYVILREAWDDQLIDRVREYIQKGWKPIGGVSTTPDDDYVYLQAMIKE